MKKQCLVCDTEFEATSSEINRGNAKFCSRRCSHKGRKKPVKKIPNVTCAYCQKPFYKNNSKQKKSKHGIFFCCRKHKDLGQKLENGITEIHPSHYGTGRVDDSRHYRSLVDIINCSRCKWDKIPEILEVHHKDGNRMNDNIDNLEVLCLNCHAEHHFLTKTGKWCRNEK